MLSTRQLGRVLGLSAARGGQLAQLGCPRDDEKKAREWYQTHVRPMRRAIAPGENSPAKETAREEVQTEGGENSPPKLAVSLPEGNGDSDVGGDLSATLGRMRTLEHTLVVRIEQALKAENYASLVFLRREYAAMAKTLFEAEAKFIRIQKERAKLAPWEELQSFLMSLLTPLSTDLRSLPSRALNEEERKGFERESVLLLAKAAGYITEAQKRVEAKD